MSDYRDFYALCEKNECKFRVTAELCDYTSFKIGGRADVMVFPDTLEKIKTIVSFANEQKLPVFLLGKGSNLLVSDEGVRGIVINTCEFDKIELVDETTIVCQSGVSLMRLCRFALENSLTGLEFAFGIPGTAGGAAYMNAGAYGGEMKDVLVKCDHLDAKGECGSFEGESLELGYRKSVYSDKNYVITSLTLKLRKGDSEEIKAKMNDLMSRRKDKQPLEYPSAGSTFKRPEGYFAGALIEQCGLKGFTVGGAQVSEKHAGFVINVGGATAKDVNELIAHCQKVVFENTGVTLEPEVKMI